MLSRYQCQSILSITNVFIIFFVKYYVECRHYILTERWSIPTVQNIYWQVKCHRCILTGRWSVATVYYWEVKCHHCILTGMWSVTPVLLWTTNKVENNSAKLTLVLQVRGILALKQRNIVSHNLFLAEISLNTRSSNPVFKSIFFYLIFFFLKQNFK